MRRSIAAVASIVLVAALSATTSRASTPTFTAAKAASGFTEPGVHVGDDGTIFLDGPSGTPGHSELYRSDDGGANFTEVPFPRPFNSIPGGGDSDVAIRGERLYYLDLWLGSNSVTASLDGGKTWAYGNPITSVPGSDRQWIALGPRDATTDLDTLYALYAQVPTGQVMIARSSTGGLTWEMHKMVPGALGSARNSTAQLQSDGDKFVAFAWEDNGEIKVAKSADGGDTWTTTAPIGYDVAANIPGFAMSGDNMHVSWTNRSTRKVYVASSNDKGETWTAPLQLNTDSTDTNVFAWVAARGDKAAVVWYGTDSPEAVRPDDVGAGALWFARYSESTDGGATWTTEVNVEEKHTKKGPICTRGLSCDLSGFGNRELGDYLSVEITPQGQSLVAYGGTLAAGVRLARQTM